MPILENKAKYGRRNVLKTLGASSASLSLLSSPVSAKETEHLKGVAYDTRTHEILSDATATVTRSAAGIKGKITLGKQTFPINVGSPEHLKKPNTPVDQTRYKKELSGPYAQNGVNSQLFIHNRPECLAGWIASFSPHHRMKFDRVGFCLMHDYETAHSTIGGEN